MPAVFSRSIPKPAPPEPAGAWPGGLLAIGSVAMIALLLASRVFGLDPSPLTWYLARASGVTLYLLLWGSTMLGLGLSTHLLDWLANRGLVFSLHLYLTLLSFAFLGLHMLALALDAYTGFTLADLLIPFHAGVREPWTGMGIAAAWLLLGLTASFPLRAITGFRFWRLAHWLTFPLMLLGLAHGVGAGSDTSTPVVMALYLVTGSIATLFVLYRGLRGPRKPAPLVVERPAPLDRMTLRSPRRQPESGASSLR